MTSIYNISMLFSKTHLKPDFTNLWYSDDLYHQDLDVNIFVNTDGEVCLRYSEYEDWEEMLKRLDDFVGKQVQDGSNSLLAMDFDGLDEHFNNVKIETKYLPLEDGKLKDLNINLIWTSNEERLKRNAGLY